MMDMFTIILVFLLNFLDPASTPSADLLLPSGRSVQGVDAGVLLTVTPERILVSGEEVMRLEGGALPADASRTAGRLDHLYERLADAGRARAAMNPQQKDSASNAVLVVQCDRSVPFSVLGELLYTAGQAGFGQFRFVVISTPG